MKRLKINFPMHFVGEQVPALVAGDPRLTVKSSLIDRKAPFLLIYPTLTRLGHDVGAYPPGECDLNLFWTGKHVPESEKDSSIIFEMGWIPRWSYQVSPRGSNFQGHYAEQYHHAPLDAAGEQWTRQYLDKMRRLSEQSLNPAKVEQLRRKLKTPFVFFAFQLANDFNLKYSDTDLARYYTTGTDQNVALAQACIDKVEASGHAPAMLYKQHPFDPTANFRGQLRSRGEILDNEADYTTHEIFATGLCQGAISINSNSLHEAAVWNIPCVCFGKLIWNRNTPVPPFPASLSVLSELARWKPFENPVTLAYLHHLLRNQWVLTDFQNGLMVEALLASKGLCEPFALRAREGLYSDCPPAALSPNGAGLPPQLPASGMVRLSETPMNNNGKSAHSFPNGSSNGTASRGAPEKMRIMVLDEPPRHQELFGDAFRILGCEVVGPAPEDAEAVLALRPSAILLSREWSYGWRLIAAAARRVQVPVIYVMDGVIEWSYVWNNLSFVKPEGTVLQPLLASHLCVVGRHPARILAGLGLADRIHLVGLPRLDPFNRTRTVGRSQLPKILVATAKTLGHNAEQKTLVRQALRDLKNWFQANPFVAPVWRIAEQAAAEIGVQSQREGTLEQALDGVAGVISFSSTCLLEAMSKGVPTAQLDYRSVPLYVQTAWEIRCAEHIPGVIQELLYPPAEKVAFQDQCLEDELEPGNASERLAQIIRQAVAEALQPASVAPAQPAASFGKLDFRQVHSQLSGFSASLHASLQYELDALQNLYDRAQRELQGARQELEGARARLAEVPPPSPSCAHGRHEVSPTALGFEDRNAPPPVKTFELPSSARRVEPALASAGEADLLATIRRDPDDLDLLVQLGALYLQDGRFMEAARTYNKVLDRQPNDLSAILALVQCDLQQGDLVAARLHCLRALKVEPVNAAARECMAEVCRRTLVTDPDNGVAKETLRSLLPASSQRPAPDKKPPPNGTGATVIRPAPPATSPTMNLPHTHGVSLLPAGLADRVRKLRRHSGPTL